MTRKALAGWSSVANLKFHLDKNNGDTRISFQQLTSHPDGCRTALSSGHLAHASMRPRYVHINGAGFSWALKKGQRGTPMLELMAHELGHNLGLSHSHGSGDLMRPSNRRMSYEIVHFSATDKQRIQAIHGKPVGGGGGKRKRRGKGRKKFKRRKKNKRRKKGKKRNRKGKRKGKRKRKTKNKRKRRRRGRGQSKKHKKNNSNY